MINFSQFALPGARNLSSTYFVDLIERFRELLNKKPPAQLALSQRDRFIRNRLWRQFTLTTARNVKERDQPCHKL